MCSDIAGLIHWVDGYLDLPYGVGISSISTVADHFPNDGKLNSTVLPVAIISGTLCCRCWLKLDENTFPRKFLGVHLCMCTVPG